MRKIDIINYVDAIAFFHPEAEVNCIGDPSVYENITWERGSFLPTKETLDSLILTKAKEDQINALSDACQLVITSGFQSNALGSLNVYDSEEVDQLNIIGSVSMISPTPIAPDGYTTYYAVRPVVDGVVQAKTYAVHNYYQLRQAMTDGAQFKLDCLIKFNAKRDYVNANCSTIEQILAVTWDSVES